MSKRKLTVANGTAPERRPFFEAMQELVADAGNPTVRDIAHDSGMAQSYVHRTLRGPDLPSMNAVQRVLGALDQDHQLDRISQLMTPAPVLRVLPGSAPVLSSREVDVLLVWLAAESKAEAAERLRITASTVNTHLTRIRAKYTAAGRPARSKANLFARAIQDGYTRLEDW